MLPRSWYFCAIVFIVTSEKSEGRKSFPFRVFGHYSAKYRVLRTRYYVPPEKVTTKCLPEFFKFKDDIIDRTSYFQNTSGTQEFHRGSKLYVDRVTLFEYIFTTEIINYNIFPLDDISYTFEFLRRGQSILMNKVLMPMYLMPAEFESKNEKVCTNSRNHTLHVVPGMRGCIFFQTDLIVLTEKEPTITRVMPVTFVEVLNAIKPFKSNSDFSAIVDLVFEKGDTQNATENNGTNICSLSVSMVSKNYMRLAICVYSPGKEITKFANINEDDYLCPIMTVQVVYIQSVKPLYTLLHRSVIPLDKVSFQGFCNLKAKIQLEKDTVSMRIRLTISSTFKNAIRKKPNNIPTKVAFDEAIKKTCPFQRELGQSFNDMQTYYFNVSLRSFYLFQVFILKLLELVSLDLFEPCHYQRQYKERIAGTKCTIYMPIIDGHAPVITGGLTDRYKKVSNEKNGASLLLVEPRSECSDIRTQSRHLAILLPCFTIYCDDPASVKDTIIETHLNLKVCASGSTGHSGELKMNKDPYSLACYFKISISNMENPVYEFGILKLETFNLKMVKKNWGNITFDDCISREMITCITGNSIILCCCKAGLTEPPCNSREKALNKLSASQLRASVRCSTSLKLKYADSQQCAKVASTPRLCVSVFNVQKENDKTIYNVTLSRETCDLEVLHETNDFPRTFCHAHRTNLIGGGNSTLVSDKNCYSSYFHDSNKYVTPNEAQNRIISCCSPEYYEEKRDALGKMKFMTIGSFLRNR